MNFKNFTRKLGTGLRIGTEVAASISQFAPIPAAIPAAMRMGARTLGSLNNPAPPPPIPTSSADLLSQLAVGEIDTPHELAVQIVLGLVPTLPPALLNKEALSSMTAGLSSYLEWAYVEAVRQAEAAATPQEVESK
jgi:hypothetical protein